MITELIKTESILLFMFSSLSGATITLKLYTPGVPRLAVCVKVYVSVSPDTIVGRNSAALQDDPPLRENEATTFDSSIEPLL
ncbi:hypothetical protein SDC9_61865 [bioreactor metagenome]|uniref:Uncharacterized protein n=1 Tax=bioreactor metagenome TaxID=1076179 RepID=A0A644XN45_9ZZZZ